MYSQNPKDSQYPYFLSKMGGIALPPKSNILSKFLLPPFFSGILLVLKGGWKMSVHLRTHPLREREPMSRRTWENSEFSPISMSHCFWLIDSNFSILLIGQLKIWFTSDWWIQNSELGLGKISSFRIHLYYFEHPNNESWGLKKCRASI
mgnify:CR=1 FL=1